MDSKANQALKGQIYQKFKQFIQQKHEILIYKILGYSNIEENKKVDLGTKEAVKGDKI